ncbi:unnamed protein product [Schistosoma guineensis]|nr:unnamed protein product [Schistosoma guineensis]
MLRKTAEGLCLAIRTLPKIHNTLRKNIADSVSQQHRWFAKSVSRVLRNKFRLTGERKLGKVITPDPWKAGARNTVSGGGRKLNENKLLTSSKNRFSPYSNAFPRCRICAQTVHQPGSYYCQQCAFKKGICSMCGVRLVNTTQYNQSAA